MADELKRMNGLEFSPILSSAKLGRRSLPSDYTSSDRNYDSYQHLQNSTPNILSKKMNLGSNNNSNFGILSKKLTFGTPSYPSPLDRIRTGRWDRAGQLGLNNGAEASFEINQSFPKVRKSKLCLEDTMTKPKVQDRNNKKYGGVANGLNDVSFVSGHSRGSFTASSDHLNQSLGENWSFYNYIGGGQPGMTFPSTIRNPNKAICTIDAKTSEILIANDMACELFGYETDSLIGRKLKDLIKLKPKDQATIMESHLEEKTGEVVSISGKVVDAVDSNGLILPISLWVRKLEHLKEPRCLVVMEPVERRVALVTFNSQGTILSCDHQLAYLYGYIGPDDVEGLEMKHLIPSFKLPEDSLTKDVRKQRATGRTKDGASFPLSIFVKLASEVEDDPRNIPPGSNLQDEEDYEDIFLGIIWVFSSISGLITFLPDGTIHSINENFALMLFGYSSVDLVGKDISKIIPEFYDILKLEESVSLSDVNNRQQDNEDIYVVDLPQKKVYGDADSSDDQGIGSSITSSQYQGPKIDLHHDGLSVLVPGVTSTPNKPLHTDSFYRKSVTNHVLEDNSPDHGVSDPVVTKLDLCSQSDEEDNEISLPIVHTDARSPPPPSHEDCNNVSVSSTDTIPTAREVINTKMCDIKDDACKMCNKMINRLVDKCDCQTGNVQYEKQDELVGEDSVLDNLDLSSTQELLAARIGVIDLNSSGSSEEDSSVMTDHQLTGSSLGGVADISNGAQSSSAIVKETSIGGYKSDKELPAPSVDYIPKCSPMGHSDSSSSDDCSVDMEHRLLHDLISPLKNSSAIAGSCQQKKDTSNTSGNLPHESTSFNNPESFSSDGGCQSEIFSSRNTSHVNKSLENDIRKTKNSSHGETNSRGSSLQSSKSETLFPEGSFTGDCQHRDGSRLGIVFQIKRIEMDNGNYMYSMWVSRDPEEVAEEGRSFGNLTLASSFNSTMDKSCINQSLGEALIDRATSDSKVMDYLPTDDREIGVETNKVENVQLDMCSPGNGLYDLHYETLSSIGKGAFGFVKLGKRKCDKVEVVVKFIKRVKVLSECWVTDETYGKIPLEVSLLTKIRHPNIVKVLDVFENDIYIQMVMEKHGSGMDLFEFIDRGPLLDEALSSYIFRQITAAVSYLHSKNILHRDIKDENVIINEQFHIKLIDFGAAAYLLPGKLFGTFCGTLEYCSPEVLQGNKYKGPELELWSMGVTLYTLIFGENPFFDVDEIIQCVLKPPFNVSRSLMFLLMSLLHPNPDRRMSIAECEIDPWVNQPIDIQEYKWSEVLPNSEFHGNTASDNRIDSPEQKAGQQQSKLKQNGFTQPDYHSTPNKAVYSSYNDDNLFVERDAGSIPFL